MALIRDTKEKVFENFKTILGESSDEIIIGNEKVTYAEILPNSTIKEYVEPTLTLTKWNKEETLSIIYPDQCFSNKTLVDGEVRMSNGKEGFYFRQADQDTLKFGLILNEIPQNTQTWIFKLKGWENFDFFYQPPLKNVNLDGSTWEGKLLDGIYPENYRPADVVGSYAVFHKNKVNNQYKTGKLCHIYRPRLIDADNNFLGWVDLIIKDGDYVLSINNIPQDVLDKAKLPIKFNDTCGVTSDGGSEVQMQAIDDGGHAMRINGTMPAIGTITAIHIWARSSFNSQNSRSNYYSDTSGKPDAKRATTDAYPIAIAQAASRSDYTYTITGLEESVGAQLWVGFRGETYCYVGYDTTGTNDYFYTNTTFLNIVSALTNPFDSAAGSNVINHYQAACYATYTASYILTPNAIYVEEGTPTRQTILHQFEDHNTNNTDQIALSCNCQTNLSPLISTVYLQIYNRTQKSWETIAQNDTAAANTDFTLSKTITTGLTDYYSADFWISCRVVQEVR